MEHKPQWNEHKCNRTKWKAFEIICYCKDIELEGCGIEWRLEMRYTPSKKEKNRKLQRDILPMLKALRAELRTLPDYYEEAQAAMNTTLVRKFRESVAGSGGAVRLNEFIFLNRDRVFSWQQMKGLFAELGSKNPDNSTRNYSRGHKGHHLIRPKDFKDFIKMLAKSIELWVKNDTKLTDFFNGRNGANPDKSTGAPF